MENDWKAYLLNAIETKISLQGISDYLRSRKENDLEREDVKRYLNNLRNGPVAEDVDDRILEVLDIVEGFCQEKYKVW